MSSLQTVLWGGLITNYTLLLELMNLPSYPSKSLEKLLIWSSLF